MAKKQDHYQMQYDEFLYVMTMNLAGNDGNNISFQGRLKNYENLSPNQEYSLVNTLCLLTNARDWHDTVAHRAVQESFTALKYIKNPDLQDMLLEEIDYAASGNCSINPPEDVLVGWIADYTKQNNDARINQRLAGATIVVMDRVKKYEALGMNTEDQLKKYKSVNEIGIQILQCVNQQDLTKTTKKSKALVEKYYIPVPEYGA